MARWSDGAMERSCEGNEQLKEVIYIELHTDAWQDSKYTNGINFKKFSIQFTLYQGLKHC